MENEHCKKSGKVKVRGGKKLLQNSIETYPKISQADASQNLRTLMSNSTLKILTYSIIVFLLSNLSAHGADYYVAADGNNQNSGKSIEKPFANIGHAIKVMRAGDNCYIRGGMYRENINLSGKAGTSNRPITITNYEGEEVTLDGTLDIKSDWKLDKGNVYKTKLKHDITQLFVDGKLMTLARFPNALAFSDTVWNRNAARCMKSRESTNGHVVQGKTGEKSIANAGVCFNGCVALLNFGAHATGTRIVKKHKKGAGEFDYAPKLYKYKTTLGFFFEGGVGNAERAMLDSPQEWAYDEKKKDLYFWADDGENPNGRKIAGKVQTYAIVGDAKTKHIVIDGINFFATAFSFSKSDHITIQNCNFDYYASSKRSLGVLGPSETANFSGEPEDFCSDITIFNCQFRHADASAFVGSYVDNIRVENNLFSQIDYACANNDVGEAKGFQPSISFRISKGRNLVYRRNTFSVSGNAQTIAASMAGISQKRFLPEKHKPASFAAPIFEYNLNTACGRLHTDGSSLYMAHANQVESVIRYNWFIGNGQRDFRWDGNNKPLQGVHGNLYRNVALDTGVKKFSASGGNGFRVKGSYNEVYNNLGLGRGSELNIATEKGGNAETTTRNNAATHFTDLPIPGVSSHNFTGGKKQRNLKTLLRDISNWDFRPRKDAVELIDKGTPVKCSARGKKLNVTKGFHGKAPDVGAYEYMNNAYWIPGRQKKIASMPIPKDASKNVATDTDLIYLIGLNGTKANVFFGTSSDDLKQVAIHVAPNNIVRLSEAKDTQDLKSGTTYYWRVDTENADGLVVPGKLWTFTTE